jgi:hypothetical protein
MTNLTQANRELFRRTPDEIFPSFQDLYRHCQEARDRSTDRWRSPVEIQPSSIDGRLDMMLGTDGAYRLNDWSFGLVCKLAGVSKETLNKLTPDTATLVLRETMPNGGKPLQALTMGSTIRSIHGASYTRLHNVELLSVVAEFATDFQPPQTAIGGGTGLYCGEQDMFIFLIDPLGWCEIGGEAFAPGFFLWNSEVGCRSVGIQTFWFQAVCQNHIVWDAVEVIDWSRKHTANVHDCLNEVRRMIGNLVAKRDARRDGFADVMKKAFETHLGDKADDVAKVLAKNGIPRDLASRALKMAEQQGRFTIFAIVDALTRLAGEYANAGDRLEADAKSGRLLALAV